MALTGRTALVTGSSRNLGAAIVLLTGDRSAIKVYCQVAEPIAESKPVTQSAAAALAATSMPGRWFRRSA